MGFLKRYMFFFLSKTINFFIAARRLNSYVSLSKQKGVKKVLYEGSAEVFNHITFPEQIIILFIAFYYPIRLNCTVPLSPPSLVICQHFERISFFFHPLLKSFSYLRNFLRLPLSSNRRISSWLFSR